MNRLTTFENFRVKKLSYNYNQNLALIREHLVDLTDIGFSIEFEDSWVMIRHDKVFKWSEVSNSIIQLLQAYNEELRIDSVRLCYQQEYFCETIPLNELEKFKTDNLVKNIQLQVRWVKPF